MLHGQTATDRTQSQPSGGCIKLLTDADLGYLAGIIDGEGKGTRAMKKKTGWPKRKDHPHGIKTSKGGGK